MLKWIILSQRRLIYRRSRTLFSTEGTREEIVSHLKLSTANVCDSDKHCLSHAITQYKPLKLMKKDMQLINPFESMVMVGFAFTVRSSHRNDFLALLRGLMEAPAQSVLVYANEVPPDRAVAGELFTTQALAKGLAGLIVDGPVRDTAALQRIHLPVYATSVTPYAGTLQDPGEMQQPIQCSGITVEPGDLVMGDRDGIVVGPVESFQLLLPIASGIAEMEEKIAQSIQSGKGDLTNFCNYREHLTHRMNESISNLTLAMPAE